MDKVFKLRDIPYYNLGILNFFFLDSINSVYSGIESVFICIQKLGKDQLLKSEI